jgi:hypothetical protein
MKFRELLWGDSSDRFINKMIRTTEDGRRIFCPPFSKRQGYLISTEAEYERIRRKLKQIQKLNLIIFNAGLFAFIIICNHVHRYSFFTLLFLYSIVIFFIHSILMIMLRHERHGLEPFGEVFPVRKLTFKEQWEVQAAEMKMATWWFFMMVFIGVSAMGVFLLFQEGEDREIALTGIFMGVLGSIYSFFMLRLKRKLEMKKGMAPGETTE